MVLYCWLRRAGCISQDTYLLYITYWIFASDGEIPVGWGGVVDWDSASLDLVAPLQSESRQLVVKLSSHYHHFDHNFHANYLTIQQSISKWQWTCQCGF